MTQKQTANPALAPNPANPGKRNRNPKQVRADMVTPDPVETPVRVRVGTVARATLGRADDMATDLEHAGRDFTLNVKVTAHNGRAAGRVTGRTSDNGVNVTLERSYIVKDSVGGTIRDASPAEVQAIMKAEVHSAHVNTVNKRVNNALSRLADNEAYERGNLKKRPARLTDSMVSDIKEYAPTHYPRILTAFLREDSKMILTPLT